MIRASKNGYEEIVKLLLEYNADVSAKIYSEFTAARTALGKAATKGHEAIVELLLMKNSLNVSDDEGYIGN